MPDTAPSEELNDAAFQRILALLLDVGESIIKELKTPSAEITVIARAAAYDRVALAVRRTMILARHIAENATDPEAFRIIARKYVVRTVGDAIDEKADPAEAKQLRVELLERLDSPEFEFDLANRSLSELVQELCRDLGLANIPGVRSYQRRTPEDIAILCAQAAAAAGSGLPQWIAAADHQAQQNDNAARPSAPLTERRHL